MASVMRDETWREKQKSDSERWKRHRGYGNGMTNLSIEDDEMKKKEKRKEGITNCGLPVRSVRGTRSDYLLRFGGHTLAIRHLRLAGP